MPQGLGNVGTADPGGPFIALVQAQVGPQEPGLGHHVVVIEEHVAALGLGQPRIAGCRQPRIGLTQHPQAGVAKPSQHLGRGVAGAVVYHDQFKRNLLLDQKGLHGAGQ